MSHNGLIVEFIGLPAAGKSSCSHCVAELLRLDQNNVAEPTYFYNYYKFSTRCIMKVGSALKLFLTNQNHFWDSVRFIISCKQQNIKDLCKIMINWLYISSYIFSAKPKDIDLYDQAIFQGLWSILLRAKKPVPDLFALAKTAFNHIQKPYLVIVLHTKKQNLFKRLADKPKGHTRFNPSATHDSLEYDHACSLLLQVVNAANRLSKELKKIKVIQIENDIMDQFEINTVNITYYIRDIYTSNEMGSIANTDINLPGNKTNISQTK